MGFDMTENVQKQHTPSIETKGMKNAAKAVLGVGGLSTTGVIIFILSNMQYKSDAQIVHQEIKTTQKELVKTVKTDLDKVKGEFNVQIQRMENNNREFRALIIKLSEKK